MNLGSPLLSLALASAPTGPTVMPRPRTIAPGSMAVSISQEATSLNLVTHRAPQETGLRGPIQTKRSKGIAHQNLSEHNTTQGTGFLELRGQDASHKTGPQESAVEPTRLPNSTPADSTLAAPAPTASAPAQTTPAHPGPAEFDRSPVYLGCGGRSPACERLTTVGLISGGAGLALIAGSVGLVLTPDQVIADEPAYVRNYSRAGTTLLALGIGLATTGVLMIFTAAKASRRQRRSAAAQTATRQ